uniref:Uncharacterized protein n=1 Tax=Arundo donax TaxID=35708 RepID=A0A0A9AU37_ARUDO
MAEIMRKKSGAETTLYISLLRTR